MSVVYKIVYCITSMLGGILLFPILFCNPYYFVYRKCTNIMLIEEVFTSYDDALRFRDALQLTNDSILIVKCEIVVEKLKSLE